MNTPTPTPRTDAEITFTGAYTHTCGELSVDECNARTATLTAERDQLRAEVERLKSQVADPQQLHAHCLRTLNEGQIAHLFGERMTEIVNRAEKTEAAQTVALANWNGALEPCLQQ